MLYTGRRFTGEQAKAMGLIDQLVPQEKLREAAHALATEIAQSAPLAIVSARETLRRGLAAAVQAATEREYQEQELAAPDRGLSRGRARDGGTAAARIQGRLRWAGWTERLRSSPAPAGASGRRSRELFAAEGARVVCAARTLNEGEHRMLEGSLSRTVEAIRAAGGHAMAVTADVSREESCLHLVETARAAYGPIDVLVNNAALNYYIPIADYPTNRWMRCFAVNVHGPFMLAKEVLRDMIPRRRGAIVNISSGAAIGPGRGPYRTTPAAAARCTAPPRRRWSGSRKDWRRRSPQQRHRGQRASRPRASCRRRARCTTSWSPAWTTRRASRRTTWRARRCCWRASRRRR